MTSPCYNSTYWSKQTNQIHSGLSYKDCRWMILHVKLRVLFSNTLVTWKLKKWEKQCGFRTKIWTQKRRTTGSSNEKKTHSSWKRNFDIWKSHTCRHACDLHLIHKSLYNVRCIWPIFKCRKFSLPNKLGGQLHEICPFQPLTQAANHNICLDWVWSL